MECPTREQLMQNIEQQFKEEKEEKVNIKLFIFSAKVD